MLDVMRRKTWGQRTASSTVALGAATIFIFGATLLGLRPEQPTPMAPGAATWPLRGTLPPQGFQSLLGPVPV